MNRPYRLYKSTGRQGKKYFYKDVNHNRHHVRVDKSINSGRDIYLISLHKTEPVRGRKKRKPTDKEKLPVTSKPLSVGEVPIQQRIIKGGVIQTINQEGKPPQPPQPTKPPNPTQPAKPAKPPQTTQTTHTSESCEPP